MNKEGPDRHAAGARCSPDGSTRRQTRVYWRIPLEQPKQPLVTAMPSHALPIRQQVTYMHRDIDIGCMIKMMQHMRYIVHYPTRMWRMPLLYILVIRLNGARDPAPCCHIRREGRTGA